MRKNSHNLSALGSMKKEDALLRLAILEGAFDVPRGSWVNRARAPLQNLQKLVSENPGLHPDWAKPETLVLLGTAQSIPQGLKGESVKDFIGKVFLDALDTTQKSKARYIGETNKSKILEGQTTPLKAGQILGVLLKNSLLDEIKKTKRLVPEMMETDDRPVSVFDKTPSSSGGEGFLKSLLGNDNFWDEVEEAIERFPFQNVAGLFGINPKTMSSISTFVERHPVGRNSRSVKRDILTAPDVSLSVDARKDIERLSPEEVDSLAAVSHVNKDAVKTVFLTMVALARKTELAKVRIEDIAKESEIGNVVVLRILGIKYKNFIRFIQDLLERDPKLREVVFQEEVSSMGIRMAHKYLAKLAGRFRGGDPYWMTAKYPGKDKNGTPFPKGTRVFYYPSTKTFLIGREAEEAARDFQSHKQDEDFYNS